MNRQEDETSKVMKGILKCNMYHKDNCEHTHQLTDKDSN